jgi:hypothetical protein
LIRDDARACAPADPPRPTLHYCVRLADFEKEGDELPHHVEVAPTMAEQFVDHCELAHPVVTDGNGRLFLALTKISSLE